MNAPFLPPRANGSSRQRTAREQADVVLQWHDGFLHDATRNDLTAADYERAGSAAYMAAERCADEAREHPDLDTRIVLLSCAGRYALKARVCRTRAAELQAAEQ
jgi:hypothetical protein